MMEVDRWKKVALPGLPGRKGYLRLPQLQRKDTSRLRAVIGRPALPSKPGVSTIAYTKAFPALYSLQKAMRIQRHFDDLLRTEQLRPEGKKKVLAALGKRFRWAK
jgi:hypothetical protein